MVKNEYWNIRCFLYKTIKTLFQNDILYFLYFDTVHIARLSFLREEHFIFLINYFCWEQLRNKIALFKYGWEFKIEEGTGMNGVLMAATNEFGVLICKWNFQSKFFFPLVWVTTEQMWSLPWMVRHKRSTIYRFVLFLDTVPTFILIIRIIMFYSFLSLLGANKINWFLLGLFWLCCIKWNMLATMWSILKFTKR